MFTSWQPIANNDGSVLLSERKHTFDPVTAKRGRRLVLYAGCKRYVALAGAVASDARLWAGSVHIPHDIAALLLL